MIDTFQGWLDSLTDEQSDLLTLDPNGFARMAWEAGRGSKSVQPAAPLKCFKLNSGGTYWIAARGKAHAVEVWAAMHVADGHGCDEEMCEEMEEGITVVEVDQRDQEATTIVSDGGDVAKEPLAQIMARTTEPEVIACSEWP